MLPGADAVVVPFAQTAQGSAVIAVVAVVNALILIAVVAFFVRKQKRRNAKKKAKYALSVFQSHARVSPGCSGSRVSGVLRCEMVPQIRT